MFLADLLIPIGTGPFMLRDIAVSEMLLGNPSFDGLWGRDLMSMGQLYVDGIARTFTLSI
jgi:hypothetical protein